MHIVSPEMLFSHAWTYMIVHRTGQADNGEPKLGTHQHYLWKQYGSSFPMLAVVRGDQRIATAFELSNYEWPFVGHHGVRSPVSCLVLFLDHKPPRMNPKARGQLWSGGGDCGKASSCTSIAGWLAHTAY